MVEANSCPLEVVSVLLPLMQDAYDHDAISGLLEKHGMAFVIEAQIPCADVTDISAEMGEHAQRLESFVEFQHILLRTWLPPLSDRVGKYVLDVRVSRLG
jgi:hypothetical protein